jgi:DNA-binding transcriptional ArsR family regulator
MISANVKRSSAMGTISRPAQMRALISPMRQEIVDALESAGPCSIARLAELLSRPADTLYFHIRKLLKVGLVIEAERRKEGRHVFALYDVFARPLRLAYEPPARARDVTSVVAGALRLGMRDFKRGIADATPEQTLPTPARELWGARAKGWVSRQELARVNELLAEVLSTLRTGQPSADAKAVSVCFVLAPAQKSKRRAASTVAGTTGDTK